MVSSPAPPITVSAPAPAWIRLAPSEPVRLSSNPLPASLEIKLSDAREARRLGDELRAEVGKGVVYDIIDNPQVNRLTPLGTETLTYTSAIPQGTAIPAPHITPTPAP